MKDTISSKRSSSVHNLLDYPFDLYTRLYYISNVIKNLIGSREKVNLLDVGGRDGKLHEFVNRNIEISILDIRDNYKNEKNYFVGSILEKTRFKDQEFDVVTACEVLEHIDEDKREIALKNMLHLTNDLLIFSSPIKSKEADQAENMVNGYYKNIHGQDHPWLIEHFENNLPESNKIEKYLSEQSYQYFYIGTNNVNTWLMMQLFGFTPNSDQDQYNKVLNFYNQNFLNIGDDLEPTYRRIYVVSKKQTLSKDKLIPKRKLDPYLYNNLINFVFSSVGGAKSGVIAQKDQHIRNLETLLKARTDELGLIKRSKSWRALQSLNKLKDNLRIQKKSDFND